MGKRNTNKRKFKIPEEAKELSKLTWKKFKKENNSFYSGKKELEKLYYSTIMDLLPVSLETITGYGNIPQVRGELKSGICSHISDENFLKYLKKSLKKEDIDPKDVQLLPSVIFDIILEARKVYEEELKINPEAKPFDVRDLLDVSELILTKRIKKLKKIGLEENVALDILMVIPTPKICERSTYYHIGRFFRVLYEHAKVPENKFDIEKLMKIVFDKESYPAIISFALLERKEKTANFTESQKKLFNDITNWVFLTLEESPKDVIRDILERYADIRKRDAAENKDSNRRYHIGSLPPGEYPKIIKRVSLITAENESFKKFF